MIPRFGRRRSALAADNEDNALTIARESHRGESTEAYRRAVEHSEALLRLEDGWDSYKARRPSPRSIEFALSFLREAIDFFLDDGVEMPAPFLVPTLRGGVQFEWRVGNRELELEIQEPEQFLYLAVDGDEEREGPATRWRAMRLIRWVISGDEV